MATRPSRFTLKYVISDFHQISHQYKFANHMKISYFGGVRSPFSRTVLGAFTCLKKWIFLDSPKHIYGKQELATQIFRGKEGCFNDWTLNISE